MTLERSIAGHRVLRLLARGERSDVWLAAGEVVLKVLRAPVPIGQPGLETEALHRARDEHVVELLDVSLGAEGAVLVFPRLSRGSLADLLGRRQSLDAGEAVTVLAPIAGCVSRGSGRRVSIPKEIEAKATMSAIEKPSPAIYSRPARYGSSTSMKAAHMIRPRSTISGICGIAGH